MEDRTLSAVVRDGGKPSRADHILRSLWYDPFAIAVQAERSYQLELWGKEDYRHTAAEFAMILGEEFGELCEALHDLHFVATTSANRIQARTEAIQVAAVGLRIVEWLDNKTIPSEIRKQDTAVDDLVSRLAAAISGAFIGRGFTLEPSGASMRAVARAALIELGIVDEDWFGTAPADPS